MLLPQTVGPFFDTKVHKAAIKAMSNMQVLLCRDKMSYDLVHKDVPDVLSAEIIDMAFYMPYTKDDLILKKGSINVGIGISKMLWNKNLDEVMSYKDNYRELMSRVIEKFLSMDNVYLHLIPHVVCENVSLGNDYELCYDLWKHYHNERIILSPFFIDPIKAKNYISTMDFFTGARMHACIGAFSSGVPVFPIAYSRKFNGLFMETLGYNHVGDLTTMSNDEVIKNLMDTFDNRTAIKEEIAILLNTVVKEKYEVMKMHISKFLKS
jgi:colanic acid/amylovoran biosynthesis protein